MSICDDGIINKLKLSVKFYGIRLKFFFPISRDIDRPSSRNSSSVVSRRSSIIIDSLQDSSRLQVMYRPYPCYWKVVDSQYRPAEKLHDDRMIYRWLYYQLPPYGVHASVVQILSRVPNVTFYTLNYYWPKSFWSMICSLGSNGDGFWVIKRFWWRSDTCNTTQRVNIQFRYKKIKIRESIVLQTEVDKIVHCSIIYLLENKNCHVL